MLVCYHVGGGVPPWGRREAVIGFLEVAGGIGSVVGPDMLSIGGVGMGVVAESGLGVRSLDVVADPDIVEVDPDVLATVQVLIVVGDLHVWFGFVDGRRCSVAWCTFVGRDRLTWSLRGSCGW